MRNHAPRLAWVLLLLPIVGVAHAAESASTATDAEKSYLALRNSKDASIQLLGERWYALIKVRDWSDASGKFQATAKYVEQDEANGTVTLCVTKGTGKDKATQDRKIPIDKLSKECQSRVKQIAFLTDKVDEAAKAEAEKAAGPKDGHDAMSGMTEPPPNERRRPADDMAAKPSAPRATRDSRRRAGEKDVTKTAAVADETSKSDSSRDSAATQHTDSAAPPPAAFPPLPVASESAAADKEAPPTSHSAAKAAVDDPLAKPRPVQPAKMPDQEPWRTSFDAFRDNLKPTRTETGWQLSWGNLTALQQAYDQATTTAADARGREIPAAAISLDSLGEFAWEATLAGQPGEQIDWAKSLGLALPEPFHLVCQLDHERGPGQWQRFFPGDRVKFIGRFIGFEGEGGVRIAIRFPDDPPIALPARPVRSR